MEFDTIEEVLEFYAIRDELKVDTNALYTTKEGLEKQKESANEKDLPVKLFVLTERQSVEGISLQVVSVDWNGEKYIGPDNGRLV